MAKILIVEDEKSIADLIELNLSLTGHTCQWASLAADALRQAEDWQPDLILLDVMLPGKDGFELISELNRFDIPVIFLTARQSVVDKVQGLRLGAEDYITKPFEPAELLA
ncbi:MAG: response regulator, partial [Eubacteriales bacterium]|nr:response regulator [Eubacteriales bacterium]